MRILQHNHIHKKTNDCRFFITKGPSYGSKIQCPNSRLDNWLLHQYNASVHHVGKTMSCLKEVKIELLEHPPCSPEAVETICADISQEFLARLLTPALDVSKIV